MKKGLRLFIDNFELHFMVLLMVFFILNITLQIVTRVVFNQPLFFTEELSRVSFLWMVFLGLGYATLNDRHIRVGFIVDLLPRQAQKAIEIFLHLVTIAAFSWVLYTSIGYLRFSAGIMTPALRISKAFYAAILPLAAALTIIRSLQKIVQACTRRGEKGEIA